MMLQAVQGNAVSISIRASAPMARGAAMLMIHCLVALQRADQLRGGMLRSPLRNALTTAGNSMTGSGTNSAKGGVPSRNEGERILEMFWKPQRP